MSNKQQSSIDDQLREILTDLLVRKGIDTRSKTIDLNDEGAAIAQIKQLFEEYYGNSFADELEAEYRKGYNDNARDCLCDGISYTGFPKKVPHKHLMDDGKSHNIRPNIAGITESEDE